jgi:polysaccharide biosynthesis/export protein
LLGDFLFKGKSMKKILIKYQAYIWAALFLSIFSTKAFSVSMSDFSAEQQMQAKALATQLNLDANLSKRPTIQEKAFDESVEKKIVEYKLSLIEKSFIEKTGEEIKQFGYNLFSQVPLTFAPISDVPVPSGYVIGPGDNINILFFGKISEDFQGAVNRMGNLNISQLGPVPVSGLTIAELKENINKRVANQMIGVEASVSLGELRSITVFILGEVEKPGSYTVNSLSTLMNAILISGGINRNGTLRDIQLKRSGKIISHFDLYELLTDGDTSSDSRLLPGDVVFVPTIGQTVSVVGEVHRPAIYELKDDSDSLSKIINIAGGLRTRAKIENVLVKNINGNNVTEINLATTSGQSHKLTDGDAIYLSPILKQGGAGGFVTLSGEFNKPGIYLISPNESILSVIQRAGGFTDSAYLKGSIFTRLTLKQREEKRKIKALEELEKEQLLETQPSGVVTTNYESLKLFIDKLKKVPSLGRMVLPLEEIISGTSDDVLLVHGDTLTIPVASQEVTVIGEVYYSTSHLYDNKLDIDDYIYNSGGMKESADPSRIYIIRANGSVYSKKSSNSGFFRDGTVYSAGINKGDTIVVPIDTRREDESDLWLKYTAIASQFAITLASYRTLGLF